MHVQGQAGLLGGKSCCHDGVGHRAAAGQAGPGCELDIACLGKCNEIKELDLF